MTSVPFRRAFSALYNGIKIRKFGPKYPYLTFWQIRTLKKDFKREKFDPREKLILLIRKFLEKKMAAITEDEEKQPKISKLDVSQAHF